MKYREQFETVAWFDRNRAIMEAQMEDMLSKTPEFYTICIYYRYLKYESLVD